ncbi:unnamed protein product [Cercopithifilaria johnstoni]|uniref:Serpin domain-containing protein n=1 Tax=Cercopithifilaria johnstoni TaxID=2874296 RepID=A0A8J2LUT7_9BILA|nr:unnamed protein product [Cercopithifilaria johnstoni]
MVNQIIITTLFIIASAQFILIFGKISSTEKGQLEFAVELIKKLGQNDKSAISSPISISSGIFMLYLATGSLTQKELRKFFKKYRVDKKVKRKFDKLLKNIAGKEYSLTIANRLYVQEGFSIRSTFNDTLKFYFNETVHNFACDQIDQLNQEIGNWASEKTNGRIKEFEANNIGSKSEMLLFNTFHFSGAWKNQFINSETSNTLFHLSEDKTKVVPMMLLRAKLPYYQDSFVQIVKLPYVGDEVEMIIILPQIRFDLSNIRKKMTGKDLIKYINWTNSTNVELTLPRYRMENEWNLRRTLIKFGITRIFSNYANFEELSNYPISLRNFMHRCTFKAKEGGTDVAISTEHNLSDNQNFSKSVTFKTDQPFLYFVVKDSKTVLYAGQYGWDHHL